MFERFTERARRVVVLAQEEARLLNHDYIGTEHILLGLLHEGEGVGAKALHELGVSLEAVREEVESIVGQGQAEAVGQLGFTPRAKRVMELSLREALELHHNYIGTEHLLLGLAREGEGVATQVLERLGVGAGRLREAVLSLLGDRRPGEEAEGEPPRERGTLIAAVRAAVRQELGRPGRKGGDPGRGPLCPGCEAPLDEAAVYRTVDVPPHDGEGDPRAATFAFCRRCGRSLGTVG